MTVHQAPPPHPDRLAVSAEAESVYRHALRVGAARLAPEVATELGLPMHVLEEQLKRLLDLCLLRPDPTDRHGFTPVDPDVATASLVSPLEGEIHHRRDLIATIRAQLGNLLPLYAEVRPRVEPNGQVRALPDRAQVRGALALAANACQEELIGLRPRGVVWEDTSADDMALARDLATLRRGARLRVIYQHSARADLTARAYIKRIAAAGAEVRTSNELPSPFVVFDRRSAFVPGAGDALELTAPALTQLLHETFEYIWDSAQPYGATEAGYEGVAEDMLRDIAKLLADGLTDEAIARRLGLSVRACRRHVARLLRNLKSVSRFQAGARAANVGMISA